MSIFNFSKNSVSDFSEDIDYREHFIAGYEGMEQFLKRRGIRYKEASNAMKALRTEFLSECDANSIDLNERISIIRYFKNHVLTKDNLRLYTALLCDNGFLLDTDRTDRNEEQDIFNAVEITEDMDRLEKYFERCQINEKKLTDIISSLPKKLGGGKGNYEKEAQTLTDIFIENVYLENGYTPQKIKANFEVILADMNSCDSLHIIAPLFIFRIIQNHKNRIAEYEGFNITLKRLFEEKKYKIDEDNGRNFKALEQWISLFDRLCAYFEQDAVVDMELCRYGFLHISNISRWYYKNIITESKNIIPSIESIIDNSCFSLFEDPWCYEEETDISFLEKTNNRVVAFVEQHEEELIKKIKGENRGLALEIFEMLSENDRLCSDEDRETAINLTEYILQLFADDYAKRILADVANNYIRG